MKHSFRLNPSRPVAIARRVDPGVIASRNPERTGKMLAEAIKNAVREVREAFKRLEGIAVDSALEIVEMLVKDGIDRNLFPVEDLIREVYAEAKEHGLEEFQIRVHPADLARLAGDGVPALEEGVGTLIEDGTLDRGCVAVHIGAGKIVAGIREQLREIRRSLAMPDPNRPGD